MTTTVPSITVTFKDIQDVFGGSDPISLSEYYTDSTSGLTTGVDGIPASNNPISLSMFRGKSKFSLPILPSSIVSNVTGNTSSYALSGVLGFNLRRSKVAEYTFNTEGKATFNRPTNLFYPDLEITAAPGEQITLTLYSVASIAYVTRTHRVYINLGNGYFLIGFANYTSGITQTFELIYLIPLNTSSGNYSICCISSAFISGTETIYNNASFDYYSLKIENAINLAPIPENTLFYENYEYTTYGIGPTGYSGTGSTAAYVLRGASGVNISRKGVATFNINDIQIYTYNRPRNAIFSLPILQAKAGDIVRITLSVLFKNNAYKQSQRIYVNYGSGYNMIYSYNDITYDVLDYIGTTSYDYEIPSNTLPGNYGICCVNTRDTTSLTTLTDATLNYYSLHIY